MPSFPPLRRNKRNSPWKSPPHISKPGRKQFASKWHGSVDTRKYGIAKEAWVERKSACGLDTCCATRIIAPVRVGHYATAGFSQAK